MAVIKIKKSQENTLPQVLIREDVFPTLAPARVEPSQLSVERRSRTPFVIAGAVLLVAIAGILVSRQRGSDAPMPYVFYDLKAIDDQGHPVAGAEVIIGDKAAGLTDSFGEWRRFQRTRLGKTAKIILEKKYDKRSLVAARDVQIPNAVPREGEIAIALTLQLSPGSSSHRSSKRAHALKESDVVGDAHGSQQKVVGENSPGPAPVGTNPYDTIVFSLTPPALSGSHFDSTAAAILRDHIVPALNVRAKALGLRVAAKSEWSVSLQHVAGSASSEGNGVLLVTATIPGSDSSIEFLKNYQSDPLVTARSILWGLKMHGARPYRVFLQNGGWYVDGLQGKENLWSLNAGMRLMGVHGTSFPLVKNPSGSESDPLQLVVGEALPCPQTNKVKGSCQLYTSHLGIAPPASNWSKLRMQLYGVPDNAAVFLSGYRAVHEGARVWSSWGVPDGSSILTVIANGSVAYRRKIQFAANQVPVITVPGIKISTK